MKEEHIVTAEEPAWTKQRHRPIYDGRPEEVPDTLELYTLEKRPDPEYYCSGGERFWD